MTMIMIMTRVAKEQITSGEEGIEQHEGWLGFANTDRWSHDTDQANLPKRMAGCPYADGYVDVLASRCASRYDGMVSVCGEKMCRGRNQLMVGGGA